MLHCPPPVPDPFDYPGNSIGVLMIHGFTGSPSETRPLGQYLAAQGYTVVGPLLPGHGTTWQDLNRRKWQEWAACAEQAYLGLKARCGKVFVAGGSLGGLLTLYLAERYPDISGIVPMAPGLFTVDRRSRLVWLAKHFLKFMPYDPDSDGDDLTDPEARRRDLWSYSGTPVAAADQLLKLQGVVRRHLHKIKMPVLIFHSLRDRSIKPVSAQYVYDRVASQDKELVWLSNSGHCLWVDSEKEQVWKKTYEFVARRSG